MTSSNPLPSEETTSKQSHGCKFLPARVCVSHTLISPATAEVSAGSLSLSTGRPGRHFRGNTHL